MNRGLRFIRVPGLLCFALGFILGAGRDDGIDWATLRLERLLSVNGSVPMTEFSPGSWVRACIVEAYEEWRDKPGSPNASHPPSWHFDKGFGTVLLVDVSDQVYILRVVEASRAENAPACVELDPEAKLVAERDRPGHWRLRVESPSAPQR
jgi:hypothetical protein